MCDRSRVPGRQVESASTLSEQRRKGRSQSGCQDWLGLNPRSAPGSADSGSLFAGGGDLGVAAACPTAYVAL
ncbi:hypothetical protein MRX96_035165 [Rhipicephalus microplus]